jgi:hypothetical protein
MHFLQRKKVVMCLSIPELNFRRALKALLATVQGDNMKTATLIALILSVLEMLMQMFYLSIDLFHIQLNINYRTLNMISLFLLVLFTASLSYFFLVLYKNQKS